MTQVRLDWAPNPAIEQVTSYEVHQTVGQGMETLIGTTTENFFVIDDVPPGDYVWKVRAINLAGVGPMSQPAYGPDLPSAPATPTVTISVV